MLPRIHLHTMPFPLVVDFYGQNEVARPRWVK